MKKQILSLLFVAFIAITNGQTKSNDPIYNKFFKTYEDYKANKGVDGMKFINLKGTTVEYSENGTMQKQKPSKLAYAWYTDHNGMLMRVFDGDLYYVLADGAICFYIRVGDGTVSYSSDSDYSIGGKFTDSYPEEYYSLTINGAIEKLKNKVLEESLEKYNLTSQYENDPKYKRERSDNVMGWANKKTNKKIKYIKLINEKVK
jgi:hypothetical protein